MQQRSMAKQRKLQALVALGKSKSDTKTSMAVSKTHSTLLSEDKLKSTEVKRMSVNLGMSTAIIGSIPPTRPGETATEEQEFKDLNKPENNSDEQDRSSSPGFDSDDDNVETLENEIKPTELKNRRRDKSFGLRKRSPSSGIQIPIPRLDPPTPVFEKEKIFMQLVLPTPNLIDTPSMVSTQALLHCSPEGTNRTSPTSVVGSQSLIPRSDKPSTRNTSSVDKDTSPVNKDNRKLRSSNSGKAIRNYSASETGASSQQQVAYHVNQQRINTCPKNLVVETHNNKPVTRVTKSDEIESSIEADVSNTTVEQSRTLVAALSKKLKVVGQKKAKKSARRHKSKSENRARKALRTISFILGAFVACWTPYHIVALVEGFCRDDQGCVNHHLFYFTYFLCYANSPINPFCYAMANQQFKNTFTRILKGDFHKT